MIERERERKRVQGWQAIFLWFIELKKKSSILFLLSIVQVQPHPRKIGGPIYRINTGWSDNNHQIQFVTSSLESQQLQKYKFESLIVLW